MDIKEPKVNFEKLKGFPKLSEGEKIETEKFLSAATELVSVIDNFGIFKPIVYDMNGNIEKLSKFWNQDREKYFYLENLLILEKHNPKNYTSTSLTWLKRALQLLATFFHNTVIDEKRTENLKISLKSAYEKTLQPYHGWIVQNAFSVVFNLIPSRSELIGCGDKQNSNLTSLKEYLPSMELHLNQIETLLIRLNLEDKRKA